MNFSFDNRDGWIWLNGSFVPWRNATTHVISQGLHYASTVFEGERAYKGKIFKSEAHTKRLFFSAKKMGIDCILISHGHNSISRLNKTGTIIYHFKLK